MVDPIVILGGGGHARSCIDVVETEGTYAIAGIVSPEGLPVMGYPHLGDDSNLIEIIDRYRNTLIGIGQIRSPHVRIALYDRLKSTGAFLPAIFSPKAYVSAHATAAEGTIVMHGAVVNAGANVGCNCIVNSLALVEHDAIIDDHCHISTGARINGGVHVGSGTFIGTGAVIHEGITIGSRCIVAAGSLVRDNLDSGSVYASSKR
ncbi:MAG: NeuD/PglB/VioB family sugar acetyltransferase [Nitratireductor sp.]|nr:NeuD/PglB/VioB family sugar acetyltransferase [Nitratireductor sp.]